MSLTFDIGLRGLALGVERVEVLFEPLVGEDSGIDRTAQAASPIRAWASSVKARASDRAVPDWYAPER